MVVLVLDCWPCYTERVDPEFLRLGPNYYDIVAMDLGSPKDQSEVILSRCRGDVRRVGVFAFGLSIFG